MPDTAEVRALRAEITELKIGTLGLTSQIQTLGAALTTLNDLRAQQNEQQRELEDVRAVVVPRDEHERAEAERRRELQNYRRTFIHRIVGGTVLAIALVLGLGVLGAAYINGVRETTYQNCLAAGRTTQAQIDYFQAVAASSTNEVLRQRATDLLKLTRPRSCDRP